MEDTATLTGAQNTVQSSTDYDQFTLMTANRDVNRRHVEALKEAFEEVGNLTQVQPILVNDRMEIIDGQHRFVACKELGLPINYTVVEGLGVREARHMNILHRSWSVEDYEQSYASTGDRNYIQFKQLREEFGFNHSITLLYAAGSDDGGMYKAFRNGEFIMTDFEGAKERLSKLADALEVTRLAKRKNFARALLAIMTHESYDHQHMLQKLAEQARNLVVYEGKLDNVRQLEDVYNYRMREDNRVRFF